jgi:hypothetical protein
VEIFNRDERASLMPPTYGTDKGLVECVLGETEQDACLSNTRITDQQQFEQIIISFGHFANTHWTEENSLSDQ